MKKRLAATALGVFMLTLALPAQAAEFDLRADATEVMMPDGELVTVWGFMLDTDGDITEPDLGAQVTSPGPRLTVAPDDPAGLTIRVYNNLTTKVSLMLPGLIHSMVPTWDDESTGPRPGPHARVRSFTHEARPGEIAVYHWPTTKPGTYLYQTATDPAVGIQMGLYGALTIDAAPNEAYPGVHYDQDVIMLYSEMDPDFHAAVAAGSYGTPDATYPSAIDYHPKFFLVNGAPYASGTPPFPAGTPGSRTLIRFLNAGLKTHIPTLLGLTMIQVAEDSYLYSYPRDGYSAFLPAGKTLDALIQPATAGTYPLYDRRLFVSNAPGVPGGHLAFLEVGGLVQ